MGRSQATSAGRESVKPSEIQARAELALRRKTKRAVVPDWLLPPVTSVASHSVPFLRLPHAERRALGLKIVALGNSAPMPADSGRVTIAIACEQLDATTELMSTHGFELVASELVPFGYWTPPVPLRHDREEQGVMVPRSAWLYAHYE